MFIYINNMDKTKPLIGILPMPYIKNDATNTNNIVFKITQV